MRAVGWVRIRLTGNLTGRQLTEIAVQMSLRQVKRVRSGVEMEVRARDLNAVRIMLRGAGIHMRIIRRMGLAHIRQEARRRSALLIAAVIALLALGSLSQTVMDVQVVGAKDERQEMQLRALMEECGIRKGVWVGSVDREEAAQRVMRSCSGLTYAQVRRSGMAMELYVVQAREAPEVYDPDVPTDVVAVSGGLVTRVVVLSGEALVRPGDTVVEGQVLIRGTERMPHARGTVTARTWTVGKGEASMREHNVVRTGRTDVKTLLRIGNTELTLHRAADFAHSEISEERTLLLDGLFYPVEVIRYTAHEVRIESKVKKLASVKDESGARAMTNALQKLKNGACVVDKRVEYSMIKDGKLCAAATLESVMQIGREVRRDAEQTAFAEQ